LPGLANQTPADRRSNDGWLLSLLIEKLLIEKLLIRTAYQRCA
jgi:hypothetical protein